ncbi:Glycosyl hydrolases family 43 [Cnuella takakiae]|uniref:Glycosyl hydrolases family 43 n=1 Tax=Cnuella takakiae TaxID=1302690 RepID=A0A1M4URK8_9BACT|nr:glycoside hydrolase family 43 protein [Cnuella takakiae]OLY92794.1 beta-galactosidase [Cnuella takakiae]SHE59334.1 Glycosyl hydrolases family 43 [Cnuella takakiae]
MRYLLLCLAALCIACTVQAQQNKPVYLFSYFKQNGQDGLHLAYSHDGLKWSALKEDSSFLRPTVSKDRLMRDPHITIGPDGLYHMVWTVSWNAKGIGYAYSKDLVHWSEQRYLPVMEGTDSARNCWAPELNYDPRSKQYIIYWATTIAGRYPNKDTAAESSYNHRMYYVTTPDFVHFSPAKLLYEPGYSVIDASIVQEGRGYLMFLKNETRWPEEKNIRIARAKNIEGPYSKASAPITGKYWAEGPTAVKIDNHWVVYFDKYRDHRYGALRSKDLQNWEDISAQLSMPPGIRHGTVFSITTDAFSKLQNALAEQVKQTRP